MGRPSLLLSWVLVLATAPSILCAAHEPVVFAIDTSRSLTARDLAALREVIGETVDRLGDAPLGLLAFDDQPAWMIAPGATGQTLRQALPQLRLAGTKTVLHDALFVAARSLDGPGVVVVISDGRDEGSATTIEDVARLCEAQNVHIVTASCGHRIADRSLRRLALLTQGVYVGQLQDDPTALYEEVAAIRLQLSAARVEQQTAAEQPTTPNEPQTTPAQATPVGTRSLLNPLLLAGGGLLLLCLVVVAWLLLKRRSLKQRVCSSCGATLQDWESSCPRCESNREKRSAAQPQLVSEEPSLDPSVFAKAPAPPGLERTVVLDEQAVLIVRQPGAPPRSYPLLLDKEFVVGRASEVTSLQIDDPTVSGQHFKLVPKQGELFLVDLDTTNGTLVNHDRVRTCRLKPGDTIRAGAVEFEYNVTLRSLT